MPLTRWRTTTFSFVFFILSYMMSSCSGSERTADPSRCQVTPLGDASDVVKPSAPVATDRLVSFDGITDPRAMVWRSVESNKTHYITRVMGTEQKMYYLGSLGSGESPVILSKISGHLVRWSKLPPPHKGEAIAKALRSKYGLKVDDQTLVVVEETKPSGCR